MSCDSQIPKQHRHLQFGTWAQMNRILTLCHQTLNLLWNLRRHLRMYCIQWVLLWYQCERQTLFDLGFSTNPYDECIFSRSTQNGNCVIIVYVDDHMWINCYILAQGLDRTYYDEEKLNGWGTWTWVIFYLQYVDVEFNMVVSNTALQVCLRAGRQQ